MASKNFISKRIAQEFTKNIIGMTPPKDVHAYQRMVMHRCNNLGMKELDYILGGWAKINAPNMTIEQLQAFEQEVLDLETPDIYNLTLRVKVDEELKVLETGPYIQALRQYALKGLI